MKSGRPPARRRSAYLRWSLWGLLVVLVGALLVTLVWLAGRYEASQVQGKLDRDTADALGDIRSALTRNVQTLQALQAGHPSPAAWQEEAASLLREHREWVSIEWRDWSSKGSAAQMHRRMWRWPAPTRGASAGRPIPAAISCRSSTGSGWK
jgi:two-component system sensor histidine kinase DctS